MLANSSCSYCCRDADADANADTDARELGERLDACLLGLTVSADSTMRQEPWSLNAADLIVASPRVDLGYSPLRTVRDEGTVTAAVARCA